MEETNKITLLFSVIVPSHNGAERIGKALQSVISQTYDCYELIVVCDACTDNTAEIAKSYGADVITVDYERDGLARNAGLDAATGDWILFLDDDDWFLHEYAFQQLAEQVGKQNEDLLCFSFVTKNVGCYIQSSKNFYTGSCGHCWRRSFIGDVRFSDAPYGSDSEFSKALIAKNPTVAFWDMPLYYYNYMREGSLSSMQEETPAIKKAKLDIIITHYNEPWEVGKKLFDSISLQECVRMEDVNIIIVQDGEETSLPWVDVLGGYHFSVHVIMSHDHIGVAAARNVGIEAAVSDWILFMDFDDMFADVAALSMILREFPITEDLDIIWSKYIREVKDYGRSKDNTFNCENENDFRLIGKMFRRDFLNERNVRFVENLPEYSDFIFNTLATSSTYPFKVASFYAPFYPFYKKLRSDGAFSTSESLNKRSSNWFIKDTTLMDLMHNNGNTFGYKQWLVRTIADAYHSVRFAEYPPEDNHGITEQLIQFWNKHRDDYMKISRTDIEVAVDDSQTEAMTYIQEYYNYHNQEYYLQNDMISYDEFVSFLDNIAGWVTPDQPEKTLPVHKNQQNIVNIASVHKETNGNRTVVYCGTKETYINMIASVKSLLATTHVDKIFFLIEDDEFPYQLPDIIETRNVKDTNIFNPDGPNFKNAWTYMCLMRTAFPQMFPEYDKILSLDIDVVIAEDIGDLWDIDLTDYYFAGVAEEGRTKEDENSIYANFGVIMMNLKKLRDDGMGAKLVNAINTEHLNCPEQDAFNKYCKGHIYQLPNDYNVTVYSHITGEPLKERILHYAGLRYWKHFSPVRKYFNLPWDEIMRLQEETNG